ncbi:MAG: hypothetical protein HY698_10080 [Deltaproteobacteria bacterium]|nr:hypothetical protein [Deltaproteobacteria bacterium]
MSLFDLLSKEGRAKSAVEKNAKRVMNKHLQSPDRFSAMEKLKEIGTDEALYCLAKRFSYVYDKTIEDEQEKEWVRNAMVALGERAVEPLLRYALNASTLSQPLHVLEKITSPERLLAIVDELLAREEPGYTRHPAKKVQILTWLAEWQGGGPVEASKRVLPYLADFDEQVRFVAVDSLAHHKAQAVAREPLLAALIRPEEESRRIKVRIAEVLAENGWPISPHKEAIEMLLASELPEFSLKQDKLVRKKES